MTSQRSLIVIDAHGKRRDTNTTFHLISANLISLNADVQVGNFPAKNTTLTLMMCPYFVTLRYYGQYVYCSFPGDTLNIIIGDFRLA